MTGIERATVEAILKFRSERAWEQFHTPRTLASSVVIEAAELLEVFQWTADGDLDAVVESRRSAVEDEIADIAIYLTLLVHDLGVGLDAAVRRKLEGNAERYPVSVSRGRSTKYNELSD